MNLTEIEDMDLIILNSLTLLDIRKFCQSNKYVNNLCIKYIKPKIDKLNSYISELIKKVHTMDIKLKLVKKLFSHYYNLLLYTNIINSNYKSYLLHQDVISITLNYYMGQYYITFEFNNDVGYPDYAELTFKVSLNQLSEICLHLFYDDNVILK